MKKKIHVNQHAIRRNTKHGTNDPVITCKTYKSNTYGHEVIIHEGARVVYPGKKLSCGARVWIEVDGPVTVIDHEEGTETRID